MKSNFFYYLLLFTNILVFAGTNPIEEDNSSKMGTIPFVTTWKTDNPGVSNNNQIEIPTFGGHTYNYNVDWGDGTTSTGLVGNARHTYATPGTYTIAITGLFPHIHFNNRGDKEKIISIEQWGNNQWVTMESAFYGCINLEGNFTDAPDLSNTVSFTNIFRDCRVFNGNIGNWDVSTIQWMSSALQGCELFNQNINDWTVNNVTNMQSIFQGARAFNQPLDNWNVSNVTLMSNMFLEASSFNQNINSWNVSNVTSMSSIFNGATNFNQPLDQWTITKLTNLNFMFVQSGFNQDISAWDTSEITQMIMTFSDSAFNQDIGNWNVENLSNAFRMFDGVTLSTLNYDALLTGWNTQNLKPNVVFSGGNSQYCDSEASRTNMIVAGSDNWTITDGGLNCSTQDFITIWKTDNTTWDPTIVNIKTDPTENYNYTIDWGDGNIENGVTGDASHDYGAPGTYTVKISGVFPRFFPSTLVYDHFKIISVEQWGNIEWSSMERAFESCPYLEVNATDVPKLSNVTSLRSMFSGCRIMTGTTAFSNWNVSQITDMGAMFVSCDLFNQDIGGWNVSQVTNMNSMLQGAKLFNQDVGNWNVSNVTDMGSLFGLASSFNQDLGIWDVAQVTNMRSMFAATPFNQDISNWNVSNVTNFNSMFYYAQSFNQDISAWDTSKITNMYRMFENALNFNQNLSTWDVSRVTTTEGMFRDAISFNQDLGDWAITSLTNASNMFANVTLSTSNYDALLIGWNTQNLLTNVPFSGGNSKYCGGEAARTNMLNTYNWTITDGGTAAPTVTDLIDQNHDKTYTLPNINGTQLTGAQAYYTQPGGSGTSFDEGDNLNFTDFPSYPVTLYIYDGSGNCASEQEFDLTLNSLCVPPTADNPEDVFECFNYILPVLNDDNYYYDGPNATGNLLHSGDTITTTQTLYVYTGTAGCSDENQFIITIYVNPTADNPADVAVCTSYTLPVLSANNFYYDTSGGTGNIFSAGDIITAAQTIYVFTGNASCSDENSFNITILTDPIADNPDDVEACENYILPVLSPNNTYYTGPNRSGDKLIAGDTITTSQNVYIYAGSTSCFDENRFSITIHTSEILEEVADVTVCKSYTLPYLSYGSYYTESGGSGTKLFEGEIITATQPIYVFSDFDTCVDEVVFQITINTTICEETPHAETCSVIFPKFITPNGDGINDLFKVLKNDCNASGRLSIYDRYGKLVFNTNDLRMGWDGSLSGSFLPESDYWYQFLETQSEKSITGHFSLKR